MPPLKKRGVVACLLVAGAWLAPGQPKRPARASSARRSSQRWNPHIPKVWDDAALRDWATPLAGLNARPTHLSAREYYTFEIENLRTYPVYLPGREPDGYWEMLQRVGPQPLIEPDKLLSESDWVNAGKLVFEQADFQHLRTRDPKFIEEARSREQLERAGVRPLPDGTIVALR